MDYQGQMDEIMDNFDFAKVAKVMKFLGWKWRGAIPEEWEVRGNARDLLRKVVREDLKEASIGGFRIRNYSGEIDLAFELETWGDI